MTEQDFGFRTDFYTFAPETLAQELPEFRILREVGKGSMGIVYEAERRSDGNRVALKVLPPSLTLTDRALARFAKEGELMSKIEHPSIVRVFEHGQQGRLRFFVMEFVDGTTLADRIRIGPLPAKDAANLCAKIADALQFAHDHGVVHRDVKPGNIILAEDGRVVITDFGLARETGTGSFTESGAIVGTPMYMAPEQILGHRGDVDSRADVYGLGATLFELLTGHPPFTAPTAQGVLKAVLEKEPPRPARLRDDLPGPLEAITLHALAKSPTHRYGSAREMADDLRRFLAGERVFARLPSPTRRLLRTARQHPLFTALILIIVVLSASAFGLFVDREKQRILETVDRAELQFSKASQQMAGFRALQPTERLAHLKEAKRLATSVLVEDESNFRAWLIRARVHHRLEDWKNALYDLDRAADLLTEPREDILRYRIDTLQNTNKPSARRRLMEDLRTLLRIDKSPDTLCIVADYMLRFAAVTSDPRDREDLLARVEEMLGRIAEPNGPAAIARAQVLFLRGKKDAAGGAAAQACIDFYGNPLVHEEAARVYRGLGKLEVARAEASMARLLRGEESSEDLPEPRPGPPAGKLDTGSLRSWLEDLGRLFGDEAKGKTGEPRK